MSRVVESSFALSVELAETNTVFSRLSTLKNLEGNPEQVYIETFGNAKAFIVKGIPDPYFNSVRGLTSEDIHHLDDILEFYRDHKVSCRFDIPPYVEFDHPGSVLYFKVEDIHASYQSLLQKNVKMRGEPHIVYSDETSEEWMTFFEDNDKNVLAQLSRNYSDVITQEQAPQ